MNQKERSSVNFFEKWILNNRLSIILLNLLLFFLVIWVFNKISFVLNPAWVFISAILPPILLAVIQYYIMNPLVDWLEEKFKVPRLLTILVLFVVVLIALIWIINTIIPIVQEQINSLIKNWPRIWNDAVRATQTTLHDPKLAALRNSINDMISSAQNALFKSGQATINTTLGNISSAVSIITMIVMTLLTAPFILFFMLKDGHQLRPYLTNFVPQRWQESFSDLLYQINFALAAYIRGQITVAFWVGVMFAIGYSVVGLPYGYALAILAGFLNLIPYFGSIIAFIPAVVIGIMTSVPMLIKVLVVFAIEQLIETRLISPLVMGNKLEMHPITTILLLIGASAVWGLWGVIFGIPIFAVLKIISSRVYNYYRAVSEVFDDENENEASEVIKKSEDNPE
ncbi:AI-2E family transporter [Lactobacillus gigeriorum]|uniref:Permease n=1 Tax=Lactobacillus gigeriorum DSM 23908 = CRBIP 24.85 TaxID=1423751 RepID=I7K195_9LACO|nr:AI-2E family transporter [Lactobacillus gigeriorum]KRN14870.1 permease [Lactobacillus gigeriorum DSM 23908 = CRBIP 24.85]CCI87335.1 Permease [Lactobacillus gigeriorum DSM 23908 = CRBIP 24.85]